jgi:hypothetical protein
MLLWYVLAFVYGLCLLVFVRALLRAPQGYEDERGFHFGAEPVRDEYIDRPLLRPAAREGEHRATAPEPSFDKD